MAEPTFSRSSMDADDDLPRTLRRERDAQARRARENELQETMTHPTEPAPHVAAPFANDPYDYDDGEAAPATVTRLQIPFLHLMMFFLKAVVAAIPALILLLVILWGVGELLTATFPDLDKMQILIRMPN